MNAQTAILAATAGAVTLLGLELFTAKRVIDAVKRDGVTIAFPPPIGRVPLRPTPGGPELVELPRSAAAAERSGHLLAFGAAAAVAVAVLMLARRG